MNIKDWSSAEDEWLLEYVDYETRVSGTKVEKLLDEDDQRFWTKATVTFRHERRVPLLRRSEDRPWEEQFRSRWMWAYDQRRFELPFDAQYYLVNRFFVKSGGTTTTKFLLVKGALKANNPELAKAVAEVKAVFFKGTKCYLTEDVLARWLKNTEETVGKYTQINRDYIKAIGPDRHIPSNNNAEFWQEEEEKWNKRFEMQPRGRADAMHLLYNWMCKIPEPLLKQ
jgi:hypothetical protein